jgi:hypothetical protein
MTNFETALTTFVTGCQNISDTHAKKWFPTAHENMPTTITIGDGGQKFKRIIRGDAGQRSVHCFIAIEDGFNKKMGNWKAGDVLKADGWKAPARGARGNIFDDKNGLGRMNEYGAAYN